MQKGADEAAAREYKRQIELQLPQGQQAVISGDQLITAELITPPDFEVQGLPVRWID